MRQQIDSTANLSDEMRQELRSQFVKLAIEMSAAEAERQANEQERKAAQKERLDAQMAREKHDLEMQQQQLHRANESKRLLEEQVQKSCE